MRRSESGSAHVIIVTLLSLALVGALGFIFWQNFMQPKPSDKPTSQAAQTSNEQKSDENKENIPDNSTVDPNEGYLVIDSWGVRFKPAGTAKISYEQKDDGYWFTTDTWKNLGGICDTNGGIYLIRSTEKSTVLASPPVSLNNEEKIGDYYYYFYGPQSACSDNNALQEKQERQIVVDLMTTIEAKK